MEAGDGLAELHPRSGVIERQVERALGDGDPCLLYTSDAADERSSVDLGGRRIIKKKKKTDTATPDIDKINNDDI